MPDNRLAELLLKHPSIGPMVVHHRRLDGAEAVYGAPEEPLPSRLGEALAGRGLDRLYSHQAAALDAIRGGGDLLLVTPTASGKTLLFSLAVMESSLQEATSKALLIYPTKALAQDQLAGFRSLAGGLGALHPLSLIHI